MEKLYEKAVGPIEQWDSLTPVKKVLSPVKSVLPKSKGVSPLTAILGGAALLGLGKWWSDSTKEEQAETARRQQGIYPGGFYGY